MSTMRQRRFIRLASLAGVSLGLGRRGGMGGKLDVQNRGVESLTGRQPYGRNETAGMMLQRNLMPLAT